MEEQTIFGSVKRKVGRPRKTDEEKTTKTNHEYYEMYCSHPIECRCGLFVYKYAMANHLNTKRHLKNLTFKNQIQN